MALGLPTFDKVTERRFDEWRAARLRDALAWPISAGSVSLLGFVIWDLILDPTRYWLVVPIRLGAASVMFWCAWRISRQPQVSLLSMAMLTVTAGTGCVALTQYLLPDGFLYGPAGLALFPTVSAICVTRARLVPLVNLPSALLVGVLVLADGLTGFPLFNTITFFATGIFAAYVLAHALERTARYGFQLELQLEAEARLDSLTGIANRRRFEEQAEQEVERARRFKRPLTILLLDLDHFKSINDRFGHATGDHVLKSVARLVSHNLRQTDLFARLGGEEFVALLPETSLELAEELAGRLRHLLSFTSLRHEGAEIEVTASIGVATYGPDLPTVAAILRAADEALYAAKSGGRNQVVVVRRAAVG
jgi:diguanylate cyclase (GGDEF)-like protein